MDTNHPFAFSYRRKTVNTLTGVVSVSRPFQGVDVCTSQDEMLKKIQSRIKADVGFLSVDVQDVEIREMA